MSRIYDGDVRIAYRRVFKGGRKALFGKKHRPEAGVLPCGRNNPMQYCRDSCQPPPDVCLFVRTNQALALDLPKKNVMYGRYCHRTMGAGLYVRLSVNSGPLWTDRQVVGLRVTRSSSELIIVGNKIAVIATGPKFI